MPIPPRLILTDDLTASGLRGLRASADLAAAKAAALLEIGEDAQANLWRRRNEGLLGKLADLVAA